ncbi:hypothetical protein Hanom_Chr04g00347331 [Helianthus anomalus]
MNLGIAVLEIRQNSVRKWTNQMGNDLANGLRGLNQVSEREYGRAMLYMFGCFI